MPYYYSSDKSNIGAAIFNFFFDTLPFMPYQTIFFNKTANIIYKKLQAIYLMLCKRYKTATIKKYKHEHVLAYTFNLSAVARIYV